VSIDLSGLTSLSSVIAASGGVLHADARAIVVRGALNIKNDWRANAAASAGAHARLYPASISYDVHEVPGAIEAEIGPDKEKPQGPLGNLLEYGSAHNPPHNDGGRALEAEEPRFEAAAAALAARALP
jgi:hypothetical protein